MDLVISNKKNIGMKRMSNVSTIEERTVDDVKYYIFDDVETTDYPVDDVAVFIINKAAPLIVG